MLTRRAAITVLTRRAAVTAVVAVTLLAGAGPARADDVRGGQQAVIKTLELTQAWRASKGAGVLVAVLDSGVDPRHRDLAGSVRVGKDFTEGANPPGTAPSRLHGTYMASLIAGHGHGLNGKQGIIGVAPEADVLSVRVILEDEEPGFREFNSAERFEHVVARGIRYAVDEGADVINMSISKELATREERAAIRYAISKGVVLVAAAGNEGDRKIDADFAPYSYPAAFPGVVSVGATDRRLKRAAFSNWNSSVLVAAPGVDIMGAGPGDEYWVGRGTSQATALVSGVAALIKAKFPDMSPPLVARALADSATDRPPGGYDTGTGFGVVNAARALSEAGELAHHTETARVGRVQDPAEPVAGGKGGPVKVITRDEQRVTAYTAIAAAAAAGALASLSVIFILVRRVRRAHSSQDA
ncbi:type VII secretion-associated serine protease mycosin [Nonomuraea solani]|uniref:Type VII secretion-associated serine protease mycosin n=1 Tax=Nonomuraea solani TaxID=1144553 RepID=A0A1H6F065_9ACTN|nr:type VII secretion-associated serine protease mycosin [Nonomuraea solani]